MNPVKKIASALATVTIVATSWAGYQAFNADPEAGVVERTVSAGTAAAEKNTELRSEQHAQAVKQARKARKIAKSKQAQKARKAALREAKRKAAEVDLSATKQRFSPEQSQSITKAVTAVVETGKANYAGVDKAVTKTLGDHLPYVMTEAAKLGNPDALLALAEMARDGIVQAAEFLVSLGVDPDEHVR